MQQLTDAAPSELATSTNVRITNAAKAAATATAAGRSPLSVTCGYCITGSQLDRTHTHRTKTQRDTHLNRVIYTPLNERVRVPGTAPDESTNAVALLLINNNSIFAYHHRIHVQSRTANQESHKIIRRSTAWPEVELMVICRGPSSKLLLNDSSNQYEKTVKNKKKSHRKKGVKRRSRTYPSVPYKSMEYSLSPI